MTQLVVNRVDSDSNSYRMAMWLPLISLRYLQNFPVKKTCGYKSVYHVNKTESQGGLGYQPHYLISIFVIEYFLNINAGESTRCGTCLPSRRESTASSILVTRSNLVHYWKL